MTDEFFTDLDKLIAADSVPNIEPGEITVKDVRARAKCHHQQARKMIERWVEAGKLEYVGKRREPSRGAKVDAWKIKEKP